MKTQATFFAILTAMTMVSSHVLAAGARDIRTRTATETKDVKTKDILAVRETRGADATYSKAALELNKISNGRADIAELKTAMSRTAYIKYGDVSFPMYRVAKTLLKLDEVSRDIRMRGGLTAEGKAHLDALDKAVDVGTQFLALASRTTSQSKLRSEITETDVAAESAFNKQLSILLELGSMDKADLAAHTTVMEAAVARKTKPTTNGEWAFALAIKKDFAKGDQELAARTIENLIKCK